MSENEQKLVLLRVQLFTALQVLKGDDYLSLLQLLKDVIDCVDRFDFIWHIENGEDFVKRET